jgi:hypothetical protein
LVLLIRHLQHLFCSSVDSFPHLNQCAKRRVFDFLLSGWIEGVVHVDGGDDVPGAPRPPGDDDAVAGAELDTGGEPSTVALTIPLTT